MSNVASKNINGLTNNINPFTSPDGSLWCADNVVFDKENVASRRTGFKSCFDGIPDSIPQQMTTYRDTAFVNSDSKIFYEGANCAAMRVNFLDTVFFEARNASLNQKFSSDNFVMYLVMGYSNLQAYHNVGRLKYYINPTTNKLTLAYDSIGGNYLYHPGAPSFVTFTGDITTSSFSVPNHIWVDGVSNAEEDAYIFVTSSATKNIFKFYAPDPILGSYEFYAGTSVSPSALYAEPGGDVIYFIDSEYRDVLVSPTSSPGPLGYRHRLKKYVISTNTLSTLNANLVPAGVAIANRLSGVRSMFSTPTSNYVYTNFFGRFQISFLTYNEPQGYAILRANKTTGVCDVFCGDWQNPGDAVGTAANTRFDNTGQLYGDKDNNYLYMINKNRVIRISVSTGDSEYWLGDGNDELKDGTGLNCSLDRPSSLVIHDDGTMFVVCRKTIRKISLSTSECKTIGTIGTRIGPFGYLDFKVEAIQL